MNGERGPESGERGGVKKSNRFPILRSPFSVLRSPLYPLPVSRTHAHPRTTFPSLLALAALSLFACFFLLGNLGYWNDDYFICSRDPATGETFRFIMDRMTPFEPAGSPVLTWRPFYNITLASVTAFFWHAPWIMHLIGALAHLAATLSLWWLLKLLGRTPQAAFAGASIFCCYPVAFEAIFWTCAIPTALSACCYLLATCFFVIWSSHTPTPDLRLGEGPDRTRFTHAFTIHPALRRASGPASVVFAALVPCFNEQAAAGIAAWPLLYLACRTPHESYLRSSVRLLTLLTPIAILYAAYIAMVITTKRGDGGLGAAGQLLPLREWPASFLRISPSIEDMLKWSFLGTAAMRTGWETLQAIPIRAAAMLAGIALASAIGWRAWTTHIDEPGPLAARNQLAASPAARRLAVAAFAITLGFVTLIPLFIVTDTAVRPRMAYITTVALCILVALLADRAFALARRMHWTNYYITAAIPLAAILAACSLSLIGIQRAYQLRQRLDDSIANQLRTLIPEPDANAVFMPLEARDLPTNTGHHGFDTYFIGPWFFSWGYPTIAQHTYRRTDIDSTYFSFIQPTIIDADATGVRIFGPMRAGFTPDTWPNQPASQPMVPGRKDFSPWIAWDRVIPFTISREGEVQIVTEVVVMRGELELVVVRPIRTGERKDFRWVVEVE